MKFIPNPKLFLYFFLCLTSLSAARPISVSIDSSEFVQHFANETSVPKQEAEDFAGKSWHVYPWLDIQARVGTWIVPLFILVGSFLFSPLRFRNTVAVALHLLSDPLDSISCLLIKLATYQKIYNECQRLKVPDDMKAQLARLLAAYEDWILLFLVLAGCPEDDLAEAVCASMSEIMKALESSMRNKRFPLLHAARVMEIESAAKALSDSRVNGVGKIQIGIVNYAVTLGLAFTHVINGDFNNRTGHSVAFAMLCTWLIAAVVLSSIVGGFKSKRCVRTVLELLQKNLDLIQIEEQRQIWSLRRIENLQTRENRHLLQNPQPINIFGDVTGSQLHNFHNHLHPALFSFHLIDSINAEATTQSLEWAGMNYSMSPSPLCPPRERTFLSCISIFPISIAAASACWISVTNPTHGVGCRSIQQLSFFSIWILSSTITISFRRLLKREQQFFWIRIKDFTICLALGLGFGMGFIGWFNSIFCWSAYFSRGTSAYITVYPAPIIQDLAKTTWPAICGVVIVLNLIFIGIIVWYYRRGSRLYHMTDKAYETWHAPLMRHIRRDTGVKMNARIYTGKFPTLAKIERCKWRLQRKN